MEILNINDATYKNSDPYISGKIAIAKVSTSESGVLVNFQEDFRNKDGVIDLSNRRINRLKLSITGSSGTIEYCLDGISDGENEIFQTLPMGSAFVFNVYDTNITLKLRDGTASSVLVELEALYSSRG